MSDGRYGPIMVEVVGERVYVNGSLVEPAPGKPGASGASGERA